MGERTSIARTSLRAGLVTLLAVCSVDCLIGRVWMVDYHLQATTLRHVAGIETTLTTTSNLEDVDLIATDERVKFSFRVEPGRIRVSIENRSSDAQSVELANSFFVDASGKSHDLFFLTKDKLVQEREVEIESDSTLNLSLWPKDFNHGTYEGQPLVWRGDSPLGGSTIEETSREKALANRATDVGKSFEIVLPLRTQERVASYRFRFTILDLIAKKTWWA